MINSDKPMNRIVDNFSFGQLHAVGNLLICRMLPLNIGKCANESPDLQKAMRGNVSGICNVQVKMCAAYSS